MKLVLAGNRFLRIGSFAIFYVAQGLPIGLLSIAIPAWLAEQGIEAVDIANYIAISSLPWGFKLFAGPIMDRFSYLPMGRRRPWVVFAQAGLLISMVSMAFTPEPAANIVLLTMMAFIVNSFTAVQDVAVDGMAIDVLPMDERGKANAFMAFGQVAGYSLSGAVSAFALSAWGIMGACLILAIGIAVIFLWSILVRERSMERILPWTRGQAADRSLELQAKDWASIFGNLLRVVFLPASVIFFLMTTLWRISDGFWISVAPVITVQHLGFESVDYSSWTSMVGFVVASLGLLIGPLIDRTGSQRILVTALVGLAIIYTSAGLLVDYWAVSPYVPLVILFVSQLCGQMMFISFIAIHMNICWEKIAATQFAIYMAWSNFARSIGAGIYGQVSETLSYDQVALVMGAICAIAAVLAKSVDMKEHDKSLVKLARQ